MTIRLKNKSKSKVKLKSNYFGSFRSFIARTIHSVKSHSNSNNLYGIIPVSANNSTCFFVNGNPSRIKL